MPSGGGKGVAKGRRPRPVQVRHDTILLVLTSCNNNTRKRSKHIKSTQKRSKNKNLLKLLCILDTIIILLCNNQGFVIGWIGPGVFPAPRDKEPLFTFHDRTTLVFGAFVLLQINRIGKVYHGLALDGGDHQVVELGKAGFPTGWTRMEITKEGHQASRMLKATG